MKRIRVFKKVMIVGIAIGLYVGTANAELIIIPSCEDVYIETSSQYKTALWKWATPFLKFDISGVPAGEQIDSVFLRVSVYEVESSRWNGNVRFWNVNNQEWNKSTYCQDLWDYLTSDEIVQDSFGMNVGETFSVDLKPIFLRDYDSSHTYCSIKVWDPSDRGSVVDCIVDSNDELTLGGTVPSMYISFYPHEFSPDSAPMLYVYYGESGVESPISNEKSLQVLQNSPNPFTLSTVISYQLPTKTKVSLKIYDITGRIVKVLVDKEEKNLGNHSIRLDARGLSTGIYFAKFEAGDYKSTKKLILMR